MNTTPRSCTDYALRPAQRWSAGVCIAALIAGCAKPPPPPVVVPPTLPPPVVIAPRPPPAPEFLPGEISTAPNPKEYRKDAAGHLYSRLSSRIYKGKMPPLLHAVGVLDVEIDGRGKIERIQWLRAPSHAPDVVAEIERMVRAAAPYPVPVKMGRVVYTETWLWHKSGMFQLDTLTEGQY